MLIATDILDPRISPTNGNQAVQISVDELSSRVFELPAPGSLLKVLKCDEADVACKFLSSRNIGCEFIEDLKLAGTEDSFRLWTVPEALETEVQHISVGTALCLACGTGREAVFLAEKGWKVEAVDWLPDALELGKKLEVRYSGTNSLPVNWHQIDLREVSNWTHLRADLITSLMFFQQGLIDSISSCLAPGGTVIISAYTKEARDKLKKPKDATKIIDIESITTNMGFRSTVKVNEYIATVILKK